MLHRLSKDRLHADLLHHSMVRVYTKAFFALDSNLKSFVKIMHFLKELLDLRHAAFIKADAALLHCSKLAFALQDTNN